MNFFFRRNEEKNEFVIENWNGLVVRVPFNIKKMNGFYFKRNINNTAWITFENSFLVKSFVYFR